MADYKILEQDFKGDKITVVYYVPINDVTLRPKLVAAEFPGINIDGSLYEHKKKIEFSANLTNLQKLAIVKNSNKFTNLVDTVNFRLGRIYEFYGTEGDIT